MFFIQSCRGSDIQTYTEVEADDTTEEEIEKEGDGEEDDSDINKIKIPNEADTLLAYATTPGKWCKGKR